MRAFIAVELEEIIKKSLSSIQEDLKKIQPDMKLVATNNIHLTLRFLGEINEDGLNPIKKILEYVASRENTFEISLSSLGTFPSINAIKVIWIGVEEGKKTLTDLAQEINVLLEKENISKPDREFSAHITLARTRSSLNKSKLQEFISGNLRLDLKQKVRGIALFKSVTTNLGPIYERLYEVNFKNI
jgi:2'-5' RNA ligase